MKRIINCICFLAIICNYSLGQNTESENITCQQAFDLIQKFKGDTNFVILDLRPLNIYDAEHIGNAIYYDVFSENFDNWVSQLNRNKVYLLYCNVGHRSGIALDKMKQMGFKNLRHLFEGIQEWKKQGFVTIKK